MGRRFRTVRWGVAKLLVVGLLAGLLAGHVRLLNPSTGAQLAWSVPTVPVVIQMDGSDDLPDGSAATAIRLALQDWNSEGGSALVLVRTPTPNSKPGATGSPANCIRFCSTKTVRAVSFPVAVSWP